MLPKGQTDLAQAFRKAVQQVISDGAYQTLLKKWNMASGAIATAVINDPLS